MQLLLVRRIYNNMLGRRLRDDARRFDRLTAAYQRIHGVTGVEDVDAVISKYTHRDAPGAALAAQPKATRERAGALQPERCQLMWALGNATTAGGPATDGRGLYAAATQCTCEHNHDFEAA